MQGIVNKILILLCVLVVASCNSKKDDKKEDTGTKTSTPVQPNVSSIGGGSFLRTASLSPMQIESQIILDELDNPISDGYEFTITGDDTQVPNQPILVSADGVDYFSSITVYSVDSKISFYTKVPTKTGMYRIVAVPKKGTAQGRYFVSVGSASVASLGTIKGTFYEDEAPFNNKKDPNEKYTLLADGQASTYVYVGPILDAFGNEVSQATLRMNLSKGKLISANPTGISDGVGIFRIESVEELGPMIITAEALDQQEQVLATTTGTIHLVRPSLSIGIAQGSVIEFGQMMVNETKTQTFIISNTGSTSSTNLLKLVDSPFQIEPDSTCLSVSRLRPQEHCELKVRFDAGIRGIYDGMLKVYGSPSTIPQNKIEFPLTAQVIVPAIIGINDIAFNIPGQNCGTTQDYETFIHNTGDVPGTNLSATALKRSNGEIRNDVQIIFPEADPFPDPDFDQIINCGNEIPAGRKCRMIVRFSPTTLTTDEPLTSVLSVDGRDPVTITVRARSIVGPPSGVIPLKLINPSTSQEVSRMNLGETNSVLVKAGPVSDACSNPIHNYPVTAVPSVGSMGVETIHTNSGMVDFVWYGTNDIDEIGSQSITVSTTHESGAIATNTKFLTIDGIRLNTVAVTGDIGQILTVNYNPTKYFYYDITNTGTVPAQNIILTTTPANVSSWFFIEPMYPGGCHDYLLNPGETCRVRAKVDTQFFGEGVLSGTFKVMTTGVGVIENSILLTGMSVNPPSMSFVEGPLINLGSHMAGTNPTKTVTLKNLSTMATVFNLNTTVESPFTKVSTTCTSSLEPLATCQVVVGTTQTIKGIYSGPAALKASGEWSGSATNANLEATIISNLASGNIPITFDKNSVPANNTDTINVSVGPIVDAYGNRVPGGTVVHIMTDKGQMSIDPGGQGVTTATTGTGANEGRFTFTIRSKSISEISDFTINMEVRDSSNNVIASGSRSGSFTGAILEFDETEVDFGQIALMSTEARSITLRNKGNETAGNFNWTTSSSDFILVGTNNCLSLAAGASCVIQVATYPIQPGNLVGVLSLNAIGNGIVSDSVNLKATALNAAKIVAGTNYNPINFNYNTKNIVLNHVPGNGTVASANFKVKNIGQENLTEMTAVANNRASEFSFIIDPSCQTLANDQECNIQARFTATSIVPDEILGEITINATSLSKSTLDKISFKIISPMLDFAMKTTSMEKGQCGAYRLALINSDGSPFTSGQNLNLSLTTSMVGNGNFYSNSTCSTTRSTITIGNGATQSDIFYYRGNVVGNHVLEAKRADKIVQMTVSVFDDPVLAPANMKVAAGDMIQFTTTGGIAPYLYSVSDPSAGTINQSTGLYTAGTTEGTFTVRVTDSLGHFHESTVEVSSKQLVAGKNYWCTTGGEQSKCIGENGFGQYGLVSNVVKGVYDEPVPIGKYQTFVPSVGNGRQLKRMYTGAFHSCSVNDDNDLYCQGTNHYGQLGLGHTNDREGLPTIVSGFKVYNGSGNKLVSVSHGQHTCAINDIQKLYCWGRNDKGQVTGTPTAEPVLTPTLVPALSAYSFSQVTTGALHTCALAGNVVYCFGDDSFGQLGNGTGTTNIVSGSATGTPILSSFRDITSGKYHSCGVNMANAIYCWGKGTEGQLGTGVVNSLHAITYTVAGGVKDVVAGGHHTCLIRNSDNQLMCFGRNTKGQLGQGSVSAFIQTPTVVSGITNPTNLALGDNFTCFLHTGAKVKCMGENFYGVMGTNNLTDVSSVLQIADPIPAGNITCNGGMKYVASKGSCECNNTTFLMGYEDKICVNPVITKILPSLSGPFYLLNGNTDSLYYRATNASTTYSNVPIRYSTTGGSLLLPKMIIDEDYPSPQISNRFTKGVADTDTLTIRIGSGSLRTASLVYRHYQHSCEDYRSLFSFNSSQNGSQTLLNQAGTGTFQAWCIFNPTAAYTFTNEDDYNQAIITRTFSFGQNVASQVGCPFGTTLVNGSGIYYLQGSPENSVPFSYLNLQDNGFMINDNLGSLDPGTRAADFSWHCR